jgi:hypothetical protein
MPITAKVPTVDELLAFARSLEGELLETLHHARPFRVAVVGGNLRITPGSGKPRTTTRSKIDGVLNELRASGSFQPGDYVKLTHNASYVLALVRLWQRA